MNYIKRTVCVFLSAVLMVCCLPFHASAADHVLLGIGYILLDSQHLYAKPTSKSTVLDVTSKDDCVVVLKESGELWYQVIYNGQTGYLYADCLEIHKDENVELGYGRVNPGVAYLRTGPGMGYTILHSGYKGEEYYILGLYDGFYKVLKDNATCYIRSDLMTLKEIPYQNADSEQPPQFYYLGEQIADLTFTETEAVRIPVNGGTLLSGAQAYIGTPYVFGGYSPAGFDCSGLVYYVLSLVGYEVPRSAAGQYTIGTAVSRKNLRAGDLVFFENTYTSGVSHVGIYAGGGRFLHAPGEGSKVSYSNLSGYWADHYCGARRIG